ncbi:MAG: ribosome recycling factor [Waddliaceae bacterium]|nr:ribosome recycling factor [Waddliaceae bacterium]
MTKEAKTKMAAAIEHFKAELKNIRTGRANPGLLDSVMVEVYGTNMKLRDIANITVPEARQLLISPFDGNNASAIGKSIEKANLGFQPIVDGNAVRINIPAMDESVRKDMVKLCKKRGEEAKVSIRNIRRDANDQARKQKASGDIAEDQLNRIEKEIQELTNKFCEEADKLCAAKEKEVCEI